MQHPHWEGLIEIVKTEREQYQPYYEGEYFYRGYWRNGKCLYLCDSYTGWFIPKFIHQVSISQIAPDYFFRKLAEGFTE